MTAKKCNDPSLAVEYSIGKKASGTKMTKDKKKVDKTLVNNSTVNLSTCQQRDFKHPLFHDPLEKFKDLSSVTRTALQI